MAGGLLRLRRLAPLRAADGARTEPPPYPPLQWQRRAGTEPPLLPWRRRRGRSHPCSHGGGGGQEWSHPCSHGGGGRGHSLPAPAMAGGGRGPPLTPRAEAMAARGPLVSPSGCGRGGKEEPPPPPVLPAGSQLHPWHNRVTIGNNREMPAFTGRLLDSAPRFPLQGLEMSENYSHISHP